MHNFVTKYNNVTNSNNALTANQKSNISTKPSTLNEEKEPMPSFLKALNSNGGETLIDEFEDEIFNDPFEIAPITDESIIENKLNL
jgi:hypothetical protein